jgi:hypothetical protein
MPEILTLLSIVVFNGMKDNKNEGFKNTLLLDGEKRAKLGKQF